MYIQIIKRKKVIYVTYSLHFPCFVNFEFSFKRFIKHKHISVKYIRHKKERGILSP
jgi:hypothetical protein